MQIWVENGTQSIRIGKEMKASNLGAFRFGKYGFSEAKPGTIKASDWA